MHRTVKFSSCFATLWIATASPVFGQASAPAPATQTLRLSVDEAVAMALDRNIDLARARLEPRIGDTRVAAAVGAFRPIVNTSLARNNQLQPPASLFVPVAARTDATTSSVGLTQKLPRFGTTYNLAWTAAHTDSNSPLNSYNPILQSGLLLGVSQPLIRDLAVDGARQQLATSRVDRDVADTRLRETLVQTTANVKAAYWHLVDAHANVDARRSALALADELVRVNKVKVDAGEAAPLDLVAAEAEVAADREQLIVAETAVKEGEDRLRTLIFDTSDRSVWEVQLVPSESPRAGLDTPDLDMAITTALRDRTDLARARKDIERAAIDVKFTGNQRLPDVRLNASYLASGLGGTELRRTGGFPGTVIGPGAATGFGSVLNQLVTGRYSTWAVGVSVNYPLGQAVEDANYARAQLEREQSHEQLKSAEARVIQQVRSAWRTIEMDAKRIETTRLARQLAEQRLESEQKRFDVGISTSFLVIQAQRDLTQARTNELAAVLAYNLAIVEFNAVQQAAPTSSQS
jgi:outer membrane protein TolC